MMTTPFPVDPNAVYPVGTIFVVVLFGFAGLQYFATSKELVQVKSDVTTKIEALRAEIAEKYCLKEDVEKKLDELKFDMKEGMKDLKSDIKLVFDRIENLKR